MKKLITVVAPAYNEELVVNRFYEEIKKILNTLNNYEYEILIINDGSKDQTLNLLYELANSDSHVSLINLSRNFGHEIAVTAGLDHAKGDVVILMDIDLQDPPSLIVEMIKKYEEGYDIVNARRIKRKGETFLKKVTASLFYKVLYNSSGKVKIPRDVGNFRLVSRKALNAYKQIKEYHRFTRGLFAWIGFPTIEVTFERDPRLLGETKYTWKKMINLAIEGLTSFTIEPLRLASKIGFFFTFCSFIYLAFIIYEALIGNSSYERGWPSLMTAILFIGGIQLISLGIIGEYIGRIFNETKNRPLYLIEDYVESHIDEDKN